MTNQEAIARIRNHKIVHKMNEPRAIYISEALDMAIKALENQETGHWIDDDGDNAICGCCNRLNHLYGDYCKHCGAKMEGENE